MSSPRPPPSDSGDADDTSSSDETSVKATDEATDDAVPSSGIPEPASGATGSVDASSKKSKKSKRSKKHRAKASGAVTAPVVAPASGAIDAKSEAPAGAGLIDAAIAEASLVEPDVPTGASGSIDVALSKPTVKPDVPAGTSRSIDAPVSKTEIAAEPKADVPAGASGSIAAASEPTVKRDVPAGTSDPIGVPAPTGKSDVSAGTSHPIATAISEPVVKPHMPAGASGSIDVAISEPVVKADVPAGASGSIDVAVSNPDLPAGSSGSIDVSVSNPDAPPVSKPKADVPAGASGSIDVSLSGPMPREDGAPEEITGVESIPVTSGRVTAVAPAVTALPDDHRGKRERLSDGMKEAFGDSVSALGTGMGKIGGGVSKLGEKSRKVPIVGSSVSKLGEGISHVGESLHELPRVARTRRGRLLFRSLIVGFVLVGAWITIIVVLQMRRTEVPDFRPNAERILSGLSDGSASIEEIYEQASPRFQEMVRKEAFVDDMTDLHATVGDFREITSVNDTLVTTGPTGRVGRVSLTIAYEKGKARGSVSLHWHEDRWKMLGVGVDLPPEVQISQAQREERVQVCNDPMDPKTCDVFVAANAILEQLRDGKAEQVWDNATPIFQKQEEKGRFKQIQAEHFAVLGHSGGGPRALACAALLPGRVPGAISISAPAPWPAAGLDYFAGMADGTARELRAATRGRAELERVLAENEFDPAAFIEADYAALDGNWSWFKAIVQAATVDGPDGMIEDDLGSMAPWGFDPALVTAPVLIMHGTDDRMVPSSHAEWIAAHCPAAELRLVANEGHVSVLNSASAALVWLHERSSRSQR